MYIYTVSNQLLVITILALDKRYMDILASANHGTMVG